MAGLFGTFNTANSGLRVQQNALSTTSHNIANVTTDGYSRQRAVAVATRPYGGASMFDSCTVGQIGTGAETSVIQRIRDEFNDYQVRTSNSQVNYSKIKYDYLSEISDALGEISTSGLQGGLSALYKAFQTLSTSTDSSGNRTTALTAASDLADLIRKRYGQLEDLEEDTQDVIQKSIFGINSTLDSIRELNKQIKKITVLGMSPNDLMDHRDLLVDELSEQFGVKVEYSSDNTIKLKSADGKIELVSDNYTDTDYKRFSTVKTIEDVTGPDADGKYSLTFSYSVLGDENNQKQMTVSGTSDGLEAMKKNLETNRVIITDSEGNISQDTVDSSGTTISQTVPRNNTVVTDSNGIQMTYGLDGTLSIVDGNGTKLNFDASNEATIKIGNKTIQVIKDSDSSVRINTTNADSTTSQQNITFNAANGAPTITNGTSTPTTYANPTIESALTAGGIFAPDQGKIGGLQDIQAEIEVYKTELDRIAKTIAYTFNSIQTGTTDSSVDTEYQVLFAVQDSYKQPAAGSFTLSSDGTSVTPSGETTDIPVTNGKFTYGGTSYSVEDGKIYTLDSQGKKIATDDGINAKNISVNSNMVGLNADNMMLNVGKLHPESENGERDGTAALAMAQIANLKITFTGISDPNIINSRDQFFSAANVTFNPDEEYYLSGDRNGTTISNYYGTLVSNLGNKVDSAEKNYSDMKNVLNIAVTSRNSTSGVSLDEEMTNIMQYQHAYQANAKMINTINQLLDVVINGLM